MFLLGVSSFSQGARPPPAKPNREQVTWSSVKQIVYRLHVPENVDWIRLSQCLQRERCNPVMYKSLQ